MDDRERICQVSGYCVLGNNWSYGYLSSLSSTSSLYTQYTYVSDNDTLEYIHHCVVIAKVQTHDLDNPTYKDILRGWVAEKTVC